MPRHLFRALLMLALMGVAPAAAQTHDEDGLGASIGRGIRHFGSDTWYILSSPARMNRQSFMWLGATLAVGGVIYANDEEIYEAFLRSRGDALYDGLISVGEAIEPIGFVVRSASIAGAGLVTGYVLDNGKLIDMSAQILESHLISSILRNTTKQIVGRARPEEGKGAYEFNPGKGNSFPSGHTSIAFELATVFSHHADWWPVTVVSYGLASTLAMQRIDDGKHWASDVFVPMVSGTLIAQTVIRLNEERKLAMEPAVSPSGAVGFKAAYRF